nr:hypothetical protein [Tanacetum cinerariifolium]
MASGDSDRDADYALSRLLQRELLGARPTTLRETFSLAHLIEARVEATAHKKKATTEKKETIKETTYTLTSLQSQVASLEAKSKFAEFFEDNVEFSEDKESVENVVSATKLPKGGNSHSAYSSYHLEGKVDFEVVGNVTPWAADVERRKIVKCLRP